MVYTNYTLKPRLENKQTIFFNTLKLYSTQKIGINHKPWAINAIFPPSHNEILTAYHSEKVRISVNW